MLPPSLRVQLPELLCELGLHGALVASAFVRPFGIHTNRAVGGAVVAKRVCVIPVFRIMDLFPLQFEPVYFLQPCGPAADCSNSIGGIVVGRKKSRFLKLASGSNNLQTHYRSPQISCLLPSLVRKVLPRKKTQGTPEHWGTGLDTDAFDKPHIVHFRLWAVCPGQLFRVDPVQLSTPYSCPVQRCPVKLRPVKTAFKLSSSDLPSSDVTPLPSPRAHPSCSWA